MQVEIAQAHCLSNSNKSIPAICEIPNMDNVARTTPEYRVEEGEEVIIDCAEGYHYGNRGRVVVTCSSSVNNFPESCRSKKQTRKQPANFTF